MADLDTGIDVDIDTDIDAGIETDIAIDRCVYLYHFLHRFKTVLQMVTIWIDKQCIIMKFTNG